MARIKVFLDGQITSQHELSPNQDFVAGRGESCDCILRPERGISRQHFKLFQTELGWELESLSRFGELYVGGEKVDRTVLQPGQTFSVPPYEFVFEENFGNPEISVPSISAPRIYSGGEPNLGGTNSGADERTQIGAMPSAAILRLVDHRGQLVQTFNLQGFNWVGGRDISCSIFIDNNKISRKQFEIQKTEETYFIRDLSSVNGTLVNGSPISTDQWTQMQSSDVLTVADWSVIFEIRDVNFEQRLSEVDAAFRAPVAYVPGSYAPNGFQDPMSMPALYLPRSDGGSGAPGQPGIPGGALPGMKLFGRQISWLNPVRLAILVVAVFAIGYSVMDEGESGPAQLKVQTAFEKLPIEKQQVVRMTYMNGRDLYSAGKYELARQKIAELHLIIDSYEDSKKLAEDIEHGVSAQQDKGKIQAQLEEDQKRQLHVREVVESCRALVKAKRFSIVLDDIEACVQPALEFDPQNADIETLRKDVDFLVQEREIKAAQKADIAKKVAQRDALYKRATQIEKSGRPLTAITAYMNVVRSPLPDPKNTKHRSQRKIASIEKDLRVRQSRLIRTADSEYAKGNRKAAIRALKKALRINPGSSQIEDRIGQIIAELRKDMQPIYHEGILEESVGNVDTARQKFVKILDTSIAGEEYYDKAKMKMRKYGQP